MGDNAFTGYFNNCRYGAVLPPKQEQEKEKPKDKLEGGLSKSDVYIPPQKRQQIVQAARHNPAPLPLEPITLTPPVVQTPLQPQAVSKAKQPHCASPRNPCSPPQDPKKDPTDVTSPRNISPRSSLSPRNISPRGQSDLSPLDVKYH